MLEREARPPAVAGGRRLLYRLDRRGPVFPIRRWTRTGTSTSRVAKATVVSRAVDGADKGGTAGVRGEGRGEADKRERGL